MARHGENIHKRKDGRWESRIIFSYTQEGKALYRYFYGKTYQEAKKKKYDFIREQKVHPPASICTDKKEATLGQIMNEWLESRRDTVKESTYANYAGMIDRHLKTDLGECRLTLLTPEYIDHYLREKLKSGRIDQKGGTIAENSC